MWLTSSRGTWRPQCKQYFPTLLLPVCPRLLEEDWESETQGAADPVLQEQDWTISEETLKQYAQLPFRNVEGNCLDYFNQIYAYIAKPLK